jgi:hypothetical protein
MMEKTKKKTQENDQMLFFYLANSRAAARPMPLAAPVMTATRPACMTG